MRVLPGVLICILGASLAAGAADERGIRCLDVGGPYPEDTWFTVPDDLAGAWYPAQTALEPGPLCLTTAKGQSWLGVERYNENYDYWMRDTSGPLLRVDGEIYALESPLYLSIQCERLVRIERVAEGMRVSSWPASSIARALDEAGLPYKKSSYTFDLTPETLVKLLRRKSLPEALHEKYVRAPAPDHPKKPCQMEIP